MHTPPPLVITDADPAWPLLFRTLADDLAPALAPHADHIEHIGSTAIPGMAAKPVLDVQVSVPDLAAAATAFDEPLAERGFTRSRYQQDHVPAGTGDDPARWTKRLWTRRGGPGIDVNLHVRRTGAPNERLALLFRDWFRAHPGAVPPYARFKRVLAETVPGIAPYTDVKDPVVDLVVTLAEPWAAATGWRPHAPAERPEAAG